MLPTGPSFIWSFLTKFKTKSIFKMLITLDDYKRLAVTQS